MQGLNKWKTGRITVLIILLFTAASVFSTNQYQYGLSDHAIVIPFLKSMFVSSYPPYPDDFLLTQKPFYYTCLWKLSALLIEVFGISIPVYFFIAYCASAFFIFLGTYLIAKTLFGKREVAFLSLFFLLFSIKTFAGSVTIDHIFLTRVGALPALIFSVYYFLRGTYLLSALLQGIGFLIHPMTAVYFITMQAVALLFNFKYAGVRKLLLYCLILIVSSSPVLLWKYHHAPPSLYLFHVDQHWLELLRLRSSHHLFPFSWTKDVFISAALLLCLFFFNWKHRPQAHHHRVIKIFVITIFAMCLAGTVLSEFFPVSIVLNLQLLRSFTFIYFLAAIYYSNFFITEFSSRRNIFYKWFISIISIGILYGAGGWKYAFAAFMLFSFLMFLYRFIFGNELALTKYFYFILPSIVIFTGAGIYLKHRNFSIHNRQEKYWLDVQLWARANTAHNAAFIVPPYLEGFRVESQRTVYCDWKDGTLLNFNPAFGMEWMRRMEKLGYKKGLSPGDGFRNLEEKDFTGIAQEMQTQTIRPVLLVMTKDRGTLNFPKVYENEKFIAYRIL